MKMILLLGLLLFPLIARVLIAWSKYRLEGIWLPGWIIGLAQDFFIASLQFNLLCFFNFVQVTSYALFFLFLSFLIGLVQLYYLIDALMLHLVNFRMKFLFFRYLAEFRDFKDSAIEYGIRPLFGLLALLEALIVTVMWNTHNIVLSYHFSIPVLILSITSLGLGLLGFFSPWKGQMYLYHNCLFQELIPKYSIKSEPQGDSGLLKAQCEEYHSIDPHYPLLKMTTGFTGKKQFNIRINHDEKPHVILIALESFGAKHLGCLGNKLGASPQFDRLAKEGVLFPNFHAAGTPTLRALSAMLFGIHPSLDSLSTQELNPHYFHIGLPSILKSYGYHPACLQGPPITFCSTDTFLKNNGFEETAGVEKISSYFSQPLTSSWGVHDEQLFDYAFTRLQQQEQKGTPTFMMLLTNTGHHPWNLPPGFQTPPFEDLTPSLYAKYLKAFYYTDAMLGHFINRLRESGLSEKSLIFITADHPQPMGEHENHLITLGVYEENHHIPLLILADGRLDYPILIDEPGSQVDLLPTIMDILQLQGINHSIGTTLMRHAPERHIFCVNPQIRPYISHQFGKYKLCAELESGKQELFDLKKDPKETQDIAGSLPHVTEKLNETLMAHFTTMQRLYGESRLVAPSLNKSLILARKDNFTDDNLSSMVETLKELHSIYIDRCKKITDKGINHVASKIKQLKRLIFVKLPITGECLPAFKEKTSHLEELALEKCLFLLTGPLSQLLIESPKLQKLSLVQNPLLRDAVLIALAKSSATIRTLELVQCKGFTDKGFLALSPSLRTLHTLNLWNNPQITDKTLKILSKGCRELRLLNLLECPSISEEGLLSLIKSNPKIHSLSFHGSQVNEHGIKTMAKLCRGLRHISIQACWHLNAESFNTIARDFPSIQEIQLVGCAQMANPFFRFLSDKPLRTLKITVAPQITKEVLTDLQKMSTLEILVLDHLPQIEPKEVWKMGEEMHKTGSLGKMTFNTLKKIYPDVPQ